MSNIDEINFENNVPVERTFVADRLDKILDMSGGPACAMITECNRFTPRVAMRRRLYRESDSFMESHDVHGTRYSSSLN